MVRLRRFLHVSPGSPWYATFTTILAVFARLFGSVYSREIGNSFPLVLGPYGGVSYHAIVFWATVLAFAILFFERQRHDDAARVRLENTSNNIQSLVETLPHPDWPGRDLGAELRPHR